MQQVKQHVDESAISSDLISAAMSVSSPLSPEPKSPGRRLLHLNFSLFHNIKPILSDQRPEDSKPQTVEIIQMMPLILP